MFKVKVIKAFKRRGEIIHPNTILEIPDEVLTKLVGLVKVLPNNTHHSNPHGFLGEALAEVDRLGRPWPRNFFDRMCQADRSYKMELERQIDATVLAGGQESLELLIDEWREFLFDRRSQQLERHKITVTTGWEVKMTANCVSI